MNFEELKQQLETAKENMKKCSETIKQAEANYYFFEGQTVLVSKLIEFENKD